MRTPTPAPLPRGHTRWVSAGFMGARLDDQSDNPVAAMVDAFLLWVYPRDEVLTPSPVAIATSIRASGAAVAHAREQNTA